MRQGPTRRVFDTFAGYSLEWYHIIVPIKSDPGLGRQRRWRVKYKGEVIAEGIPTKPEAAGLIKGRYHGNSR